jgi:uncharacterized protein with GYD domain
MKQFFSFISGMISFLFAELQNILWGLVMPTYILLSKLTSEGRKTIRAKPDRLKEVNKELEAWGAKVLKQYSLLGPYDFLNIVEAPNNDVITRVSIELGARGTIELMSMPAMEIDDFLKMINNRKRKKLDHH